MNFHKKSQTATEYMIILAVVIIIALIVVGVLGGIPGVGGDARSRASSAFWQSAEVAIVAYSFTATAGDEHVLKVRNNMRDSIIIRNITLSLDASSDPVAFLEANSTMAPGQTETFNNGTGFDLCTNAEDPYSMNVNIKYIDQETGSTYTFTGQGNKLEGNCAN